MSLAEKLAEKHLTAWQDDDGGIHILDHMLAAINEAILLTKNEWIERCAQEAFNTPILTAEFHDILRNRIGKRIRALKEQP